jgi:hypothetical protein
MSWVGKDIERNIEEVLSVMLTQVCKGVISVTIWHISVSNTSLMISFTETLYIIIGESS